MAYRVQVPKGCEVSILTETGFEVAKEGDWIVHTRVHPVGGEPYSSLGVIADEAMKRLETQYTGQPNAERS